MQLLNLFTVAGASGDAFSTPWQMMNSTYDQLDVWIDCKMFSSSGGGTVTFKLQTGMDTDEASAQDASSTAVTARGTTIANVTSKIGRYLRLNIAITTADVFAVVSVWALPKRA